MNWDSIVKIVIAILSKLPSNPYLRVNALIDFAAFFTLTVIVVVLGTPDDSYNIVTICAFLAFFGVLFFSGWCLMTSIKMKNKEKMSASKNQQNQQNQQKLRCGITQPSFPEKLR